jgi:TonB family protein
VAGIQRRLSVVLSMTIGLGGSAYAAPRPQAPAPSVSSLPGEAMYPAPNKVVWQRVEALLRQWGFDRERLEKNHQIVITRWRAYDETLFPARAALGLSPTVERPKRIQLHIAVAAGREPARVAVGSVLEIERINGGPMPRRLVYRDPTVSEWAFRALDAAVGADHEPMASTQEARSAQARRLMPPGVQDPCVAEGPQETGPAQGLAELVSVDPLMPAEATPAGEGAVELEAVVTEHGTLTSARVRNPVPRLAAYEEAAKAALELWRMVPPRRGECPTTAPLVLSVGYRGR